MVDAKANSSSNKRKEGKNSQERNKIHVIEICNCPTTKLNMTNSSMAPATTSPNQY